MFTGVHVSRGLGSFILFLAKREMLLDVSVHKRRTRVTQGHKHSMMGVLSQSCRLPQLRLILGFQKELCWLSVFLTHCILCGSGTAKSFQEPYTHAQLIPYVQPLEAAIPGSGRSGSGFPCLSFPHSHYPNITFLQHGAG